MNLPGDSIPKWASGECPCGHEFDLRLFESTRIRPIPQGLWFSLADVEKGSLSPSELAIVSEQD
jgi:hypothetical protein